MKTTQRQPTRGGPRGFASAGVIAMALVVVAVAVAQTGSGAVTALPAAPAITTQPQGQAVKAGASATLSVVATGERCRYQWQLNGAHLPGATQATLALANIQPSASGDYSVVIANDGGSVTSHAATLSLIPGRLINLSVLTPVAPGDPLTVGTVIGGKGVAGVMPLLIRGMGPSLGAFGVGDPHSDPKLEVFFGTTVVAGNDNWGGSAELTTLAQQVGAFPFGDRSSNDAALPFGPNIATAPVGYTVQVTGVGRANGPVIAEIYDGVPPALTGATTPRLINVSVLKEIPASGLLTAGFVIGGATPKEVLIRAVGPTLGLAPFNLAGTMPNPKITLFREGGVELATNDDWGGDARLAAAFAFAGAFALPGDSHDAAVVATLAPGGYTAQVAVSTVAGAATGGVTLVEVYDLEGAAAPALPALPANLSAAAGTGLMLFANATGAIGYQWQRLPAGTTTWQTLADGDGFAGTTTATLFAGGGAAQNGDQFRVVVSNSSGATRSNPVAVTFTGAAGTINVVGHTAPQLPAFSTLSVAAVGLATDATTLVEFINAAGALVAQVPPVAVTANGVIVAVPPLIGSDGTSLVAGALSARIVQLRPGRTVTSNTFVAAWVQASPPSTAPAGALTLGEFQSQGDQANRLLAALSGTTVDTATARAVVTRAIQSLQIWSTNVQRAMTTGASTFTLGTGANNSVTLTPRDLQAMDNLLAAGLQATSTPIGGALDLGGQIAGVVDASVGLMGPALGMTVGSPASVAAGSSIGASFGLYVVWNGREALRDASTMLLNQQPSTAVQEAIDRRYGFLDAIAARGNPSAAGASLLLEASGPATRGFAEIFSGGSAAPGDSLLISSDLRHGALGVVETFPSGTVYPLRGTNSLYFVAPTTDPVQRLVALSMRYYPFTIPFRLNAVPLGASVFTGWRVHTPSYHPAGSYQSAGRDPTIALQMLRGGYFVIATFDLAHTLTMISGSNGTAEIAPAATSYLSAAGMSAPGFLHNTRVTLTAKPSAGYVFSGWSGDASGSANPLAVVMDRNKAITATFTAATTAVVSEGPYGSGR